MSGSKVGRRQFVKSAVGAGVAVGAVSPTVFAQEKVQGANDPACRWPSSAWAAAAATFCAG